MHMLVPVMTKLSPLKEEVKVHYKENKNDKTDMILKYVKCLEEKLEPIIHRIHYHK